MSRKRGRTPDRHVVNTRRPTAEEIAELLAFLPRLYAEGFTPIERWGGGTMEVRGQNRILTLPYPVYHEGVMAFFQTAAREGWSDHGYRPEAAGRMLRDPDRVKGASLSEVRTMLTYGVRGERFCDGHWAALITQGHIRRLLERLARIRDGQAARDG
jgi:hypothetical protein